VDHEDGIHSASSHKVLHGCSCDHYTFAFCKSVGGSTSPWAQLLRPQSTAAQRGCGVGRRKGHRWSGRGSRDIG